MHLPRQRSAPIRHRSHKTQQPHPKHTKHTKHTTHTPNTHRTSRPSRHIPTHTINPTKHTHTRPTPRKNGRPNHISHRIRVPIQLRRHIHAQTRHHRSQRHLLRNTHSTNRTPQPRLHATTTFRTTPATMSKYNSKPPNYCRRTCTMGMEKTFTNHHIRQQKLCPSRRFLSNFPTNS